MQRAAFLIVLSLIVFLLLAARAAATDPANAEPSAATPRVLAVRLVEDSPELRQALARASFLRWVAPNAAGKFAVEIGPEATGDVLIYIAPFPVPGDLGKLAADLPVTLAGEALAWAGQVYAAPEHALAVRLPDAASRTWIVSGYQQPRLASVVNQILFIESGLETWGSRPSFDVLVQENPYLERSGRLRRGADGWQIDTATERDDLAARAAIYAASTVIERPRLRLRVPQSLGAAATFTSLADELDSAVETMARRLPIRLERPLEVQIESDYVAQGRHLGQLGPAVLASDGTLHLVYHEEESDAVRHGLARQLLRRAGLDAGLSPWLSDGAALWLAGEWYGRSYRQWLPLIAAAGVLPSAEQLLADERQRDGSATLWTPVAAEVVARVIGMRLRDKLARPIAAAAIERVLVELKELAERPVTAAVPRLPATRRFHHGVSLAMANGLEIGYHAPAIDAQLRRLDELGVDAVSLMPFAYQRAPDDPRLGYLNASPSSETDVGVIHAARRARAQGMSVLWKPHIWVTGSWPGEIEMRADGDWQTWWTSYRRYIVHHALLASWAGADGFSIGVELGKTLAQERPWNELIDAVRLFFPGYVTYSGNWWADYDQAPFWQRLDVVGVDAYFPLAGAADADRATIAAGARAAVAQLATAAKRFDKPVMLTEVGFSARRGAWVDPHQEGGEYSAEDQALAYETFLEALGRPAWLEGMFLWKVFSYVKEEAHAAPNFEFLDRPAEALVRAYFTALDDTSEPPGAEASQATSQDR